MFTWYTNN